MTEDFSERMLAAGASSKQFSRIVQEAAQEQSSSTLLSLLASYAVYCWVTTTVKLPKLAFCRMISTHFPLSDEELWCSDVNARGANVGVDTAALEVFVYPHTCATFFVGHFTVFLRERAFLVATYAGNKYHHMRRYFVENASQVVLMRTLPAVFAVDQERRMGQRTVADLLKKDVCLECLSTRSRFSAAQMADLLQCVCRSDDMTARLMQTPALQVLADDPFAIQRAMYLQGKLSPECSQWWVDRGAEIFQSEDISIEMLLKAIDSASSELLGLRLAGREVWQLSVLPQICSWVKPQQRTLLSHALEKRVKKATAGTANDTSVVFCLLMDCTAACSVAVKSAVA